MTRSHSSGVVQQGSSLAASWTSQNSAPCRVNSDAVAPVSNGHKSETDVGGAGGQSSASKESLNLMRSPSYQSTTNAMKNDIK